MGVTQVNSAAGSSSTESVLRKHRNRRKLNKKKGSQAVSVTGLSSVAAEDRMDLVEANEMQPIGIVQNSSSGEGEDDDALMINGDDVPAGGSGAPVFAPLGADAAKSSTVKGEVRKVPIPPHRMSPLKRDWINLFGPLTEILGLQVRMNVQKRCVEMRVSVCEYWVGTL
jgi:RNA-binding protein PNO1